MAADARVDSASRADEIEPWLCGAEHFEEPRCLV